MKSKRARESAVSADEDKHVVPAAAEEPPAKKHKSDGDVKAAKKAKKAKKDSKESRKERKDKRKDLQDLPEELEVIDAMDVEETAVPPAAGGDKAEEKKKKKKKKAKQNGESAVETDGIAEEEPEKKKKKKKAKEYGEPVVESTGKTEEEPKKSKKKARQNGEPVVETNGDVEEELNKKKKKRKDGEVGATMTPPQGEADRDDAEPDKKKDKNKKAKDKKDKKQRKDTAEEAAAPTAEEAAAATAAAEKADRHIVFLGNLPYTATAASITAHFASLSPASVRCLTKRDGEESGAKAKKGGADASADAGACRGIAFVEFADAAAQRTCLDRFHHSLFDDGKAPARKINVELTAGGGGKTKHRTDKIRAKNAKLDENRAKRIEREKAAKDGGGGGAGKKQVAEDSADAMGGNIHPSRLARNPRLGT